MTWIDAAIVAVFLFFIVTAFSSGLVREVISTAATIAGMVLAGLFYQDLSDSLLSSIDNETTSAVIAFLIIFVGVTVAGQLLAMVVHPAITILQLGMLDQFLGAVFGVVKAFVIVEVQLVLFVTYPRYDLDTKIDDSAFAPKMLQLSQPIVKVLPQIFEKRVDAFK